MPHSPSLSSRLYQLLAAAALLLGGGAVVAGTTLQVFGVAGGE